MIQLATATDAPAARTPHAQAAALVAAGLLTVFAVAQLFTFEDFAGEFVALGMNASWAAVVACLVVVAEVFALPFLLRMRLSAAMRAVSMVFGWLVALFWVVVAFYAAANTYELVPLLGATVPLVAGWWAPMALLALTVLVVWASWGLWPFARVAQPVKKPTKAAPSKKK